MHDLVIESLIRPEDMERCGIWGAWHESIMDVANAYIKTNKEWKASTEPVFVLALSVEET